MRRSFGIGRRDGRVSFGQAPLVPDPPAELVDAEREMLEQEREPIVAASLGPAPAPELIEEAIVEAVAETQPFSERVVMEALDALKTLASKEQPAPTLNVHLANPDLNVSVSQPAPQTHVHVPEQPAPVVNVEVEAPELPAPHLTVEAPHVDVHVPAQAAPVVNVDNHVEVPKPRPIRVEEREDGTKVYVPVGE